MITNFNENVYNKFVEIATMCNDEEMTWEQMIDELMSAKKENPDDIEVFADYDGMGSQPDFVALSKSGKCLLEVDSEGQFFVKDVDDYIWTINEGWGMQCDYDLVKKYFPEWLGEIEDEIIEMNKINK